MIATVAWLAKCMRAAALLLAVAPTVSAGNAARVAPAPLGSLGANLLHRYVAPAAARWVDATGATARAIEARCAQPADPARQHAADQAFAGLAQAWGQVEFLRFGPLVEGNRFERAFFFPDPRGVVPRQLNAALSAMDATLLEPQALAGESVALQGMPALEYALYGAGAEAITQDTPAGRYRCAYAQAVVANLRTVAQAFALGWQPDGALATEFSAPNAQGQLYRNPGEVATEVLKAVSGGLHYLREVKLAPALGATPEQARGQRAPLWRSAHTIDLLRGNLVGISDFIGAAELEAALPDDQRWIPQALRDDAARAVQALNEVTLPFDRAVTDPEQRRALAYALLLLKNMQEVSEQNLAPALGVNLGFNAFDGD